MARSEIVKKLTAWAKKTFVGAQSIEVKKNSYGDWNVIVDWDGGYFVEVHTYTVHNGKFRSLGVTEIEY